MGQLGKRGGVGGGRVSELTPGTSTLDLKPTIASTALTALLPALSSLSKMLQWAALDTELQDTRGSLLHSEPGLWAEQ